MKIIAKEVFKELREEQQLHMAVLKENKTLLGILQKGLDAVTDEEEKLIHNTWFPISLVENQSATPLVFTRSLAE